MVFAGFYLWPAIVTLVSSLFRWSLLNPWAVTERDEWMFVGLENHVDADIGRVLVSGGQHDDLDRPVPVGRRRPLAVHLAARVAPGHGRRPVPQRVHPADDDLVGGGG